MSKSDKTIYFVVAVDLSTGTKYIDDEMFSTTAFGDGRAWDNNESEWVEETEQEYTEALVILNNPEWEIQ